MTTSAVIAALSKTTINQAISKTVFYPRTSCFENGVSGCQGRSSMLRNCYSKGTPGMFQLCTVRRKPSQ